MLAVLLAKSPRSAWTGPQMALGHAVIEVPLILLIFFGLGTFFQYTLTQILLSILGGGFIIWMGISLFRTRKSIVKGEKDIPYNAFVSGIIMSALNPFFLLWWATVGSLWTLKFYQFGIGGIVLFIVVHWLCDLVWLSFVSNLVYRTHSLWKNGFQEWISIGCSLLLVGFGVWFIYSGIQLMM